MMLFHTFFDFLSFRNAAMQLKKGFKRAKNHFPKHRDRFNPKNLNHFILMKNHLMFIALIIICCVSCAKQTEQIGILETVLASENPNIKTVMDDLERYQVQIRYTQIDWRNDSVLFTAYDFQVNDSLYFYPASTVKFPAAVAALEQLNQTDTLDRDTRFYIEGDSVETTFSNEISKIFAVSDNAANNRLVEFLGQDAINERLRNRGVAPVRIAHRLGYRSDDVTTLPLIVYLNDSTTATTVPTINSVIRPLDLKGTEKGKGYYEDDALVSEPFDFKLKNYFPLSAQQELLKRIVFPKAFPKNERFDLSDDQRDFLLTAMHSLPKTVGYDAETYYDSYCKFFMFGDTKDPIPDTIKIYNKVGFAYGTLTDNAYIVDDKNKVEFLISATLLVNRNGIFNDDQYEYEKIGIPFLAELGRALYDLEAKRRK